MGVADEIAQVILVLMANTYKIGKVVPMDGAGHFMSHRWAKPYTINGRTFSLSPQECTRISCSGRGGVLLAGYMGDQDSAAYSDGAPDMIGQGDAGTFRVELG